LPRGWRTPRSWQRRRLASEEGHAEPLPRGEKPELVESDTKVCRSRQRSDRPCHGVHARDAGAHRGHFDPPRSVAPH
jgi:hypothetical protein